MSGEFSERTDIREVPLLVPSSFEELSTRLDSLNDLESEEVAFTLGALIYLASKSSKLLKRDESPTKKFSLFMKFASCVDPRLDPKRTLKNYSGRFLNYAMDKLRGEQGVPCLAERALAKLTDVMVRGLSNPDIARNVVLGMMGVRDVSYIYVHLSDDELLRGLFESSKRGFGCLGGGD